MTDVDDSASEMFERATDPAYLEYLGLERRASRIEQWQPLMVPGLLQTEEYMRELLVGAYGYSPLDVDRKVEERLGRQRMLDVDDGRSFHFILDEGVLLRPSASTGAKLRQVERLAAIHTSGRAVVQVVPMHRGIHPGMRGSFVLLDLEDGDALYVESEGGDYVTRDDRRTGRYRKVFAELVELAVPRDDMAEYFEEILREFRTSS